MFPVWQPLVLRYNLLTEGPRKKQMVRLGYFVRKQPIQLFMLFYMPLSYPLLVSVSLKSDLNKIC